ncbi:MAG TPA: nucleoside-diphosphate sugar epimerase/dehydratase [Vicinamibacterales bacterium]|nr:nucleoside-diphosphate sugar epimerase/dehydratase [Vicinamibacterales bacterium]
MGSSTSPPSFDASRLDHPAIRFGAVFLVDAIIATVSLWLAMLLRFDGAIEPTYLGLLPQYTALLVGARVVTNGILKLHRWSFRLAGLHDGARVVAAAGIGTCVFVLVIYLAQILAPPRSVVVLEMLASVLGMTGVRFAPRLGWAYWTQISRLRRGDARRTLIVGAGASGEMLYRDLQRSGRHRYQVHGFIDDDRAMWNKIVNGRHVLGGVAQLPEVIARLQISTLLIAVPRSSPSVVREVVAACSGLDVHIKVLPVSYVYFQERGPASMLHDLSPEHLLARQPVVFEPHERTALATRRVLVTGAAGSIGSEICTQLLGLGVEKVLGVDINENGLYLLEQRLKRLHPDRLAIQIVDIRDRGRIDSIIEQFRPNDIFHAAAHKHVPLMEAAPSEAVKNNVTGTRNVLLSAERRGVESFTFISSDKAVAPTSVMGATKRVGELMSRDVARRSSMHVCAVRFGNVLGSDGSVVPLFRQQIEAGGPVTITDPEMRRYFMTIPEAVGLVLKSGYGRYGDLCVLDMGEPVKVMDLARQMILMAGCIPDVDIAIVVTGLRPGEKLNEELVMEEEDVLSRVEGKIQVIKGAPPQASLWQDIAELENAANSEDSARVLAILRRIVPTYKRTELKIVAGAAASSF